MTTPPSPLPTLLQLEAEARRRDLLLRLKVGRPLGLIWTLQAAVARRRNSSAANTASPPGLELLGELKSWALPSRDGLHLDTMRVQGENCTGVGMLLWAATFAWSLECTPCRRATLLAIRDQERQHRRLVRYFRQLGFEPLRELGAAPADLPQRLLWGGAGLLMQGDCSAGLRRSCRRLALPGDHDDQALP